jgi:hypothetical protein
MSDRLYETIRLVQCLKRNQKARFSLGKGKELEGDLTDDAESPKGPSVVYHVVTETSLLSSRDLKSLIRQLSIQ